MRTKIYLAALCLPLAFAACTNEDFIEQGVDLSSRGEVDVTISAVKGAEGQADTRLDITGSDFMWEAGVDVIGAALVDATNPGTVQETVPVNYPFTADHNGATSTFSGKSSVTQGLYFFYYGYRDNLNRGLLNLNVPEQLYKVGDAKDSKRQAIGYMKGVSPIVNLNKGITYTGAQQAALDLRFVPLYTLVKVNINSKNIPAGVTPTVSKITLNSTAGFVSKVAANMTNIKSAGIVPLTNEGEINAEKRDAAVTKIADLVAKQTVYNAKYNDGTVAGNTRVPGAAVLKVDGELELKEGETTSLYILAPKGTHADLILTVLTSEGEYTRTINKEVKLANAEQPIAADLDFDRANGNVEAVTRFNIASTKDWDEAVAFINEHPTSYVGRTITFNLVDDIKISSLPNYNLTITGTQEIELTRDYTVNAANKGLYTANNVTWVVGEGITMNMNATSAGFATIRNEGTLNISANTAADITNLGVMNIKADVTLGGDIVNGADEDNVNEIPAINGTINVDNEKVVVVDGDLTNEEGSITVGSAAALAMAKNTTRTNAFLNKENAVLTMNGTLTIDGTTGNTPSFTNDEGIIDMYGMLDVAVNNTNGTIILESTAYSVGNTDVAKKITKGTVVIVDIDAFVQTSNITNKEFNFDTAGNAPDVTTSVTNGAEYDKADDVTEITNITLNGGTWTLAAATDVASNSKTIANPNSASLTLDGATLKMDAQDLTTALNSKGTSTLKMDGTTLSAVVDDIALTVNSGTLTIKKGVVINEGALTNLKTATINGTLVMEAGSEAYFDTTTVGENGSLSVNGQTDTENEAKFNVSTTAKFTNNGLVESKEATMTAPGGNAGKVTTPKNTATGTFKGNGHDFGAWS